MKRLILLYSILSTVIPHSTNAMDPDLQPAYFNASLPKGGSNRKESFTRNGMLKISTESTYSMEALLSAIIAGDTSKLEEVLSKLPVEDVRHYRDSTGKNVYQIALDNPTPNKDIIRKIKKKLFPRFAVTSSNEPRVANAHWEGSESSSSSNSSVCSEWDFSLSDSEEQNALTSRFNSPVFSASSSDADASFIGLNKSSDLSRSDRSLESIQEEREEYTIDSSSFSSPELESSCDSTNLSGSSNEEHKIKRFSRKKGKFLDPSSIAYSIEDLISAMSFNNYLMFEFAKDNVSKDEIVSYVDDKGQNLLRIALENPPTLSAIIKDLLEIGISKTLVAKDGKTPLEIAANCGDAIKILFPELVILPGNKHLLESLENPSLMGSSLTSSRVDYSIWGLSTTHTDSSGAVEDLLYLAPPRAASGTKGASSTLHTVDASSRSEGLGQKRGQSTPETPSSMQATLQKKAGQKSKSPARFLSGKNITYASICGVLSGFGFYFLNREMNRRKQIKKDL